MRSTVEPLEGNKVKLSVEVDEAEFDKALDAAFRKIAREVRINGFRPGKAPRRVLENYFGVEPAREQALRDSIPEYLASAVREHDVDIIAPPEVEITGGQEGGDVAFAATIEVRPRVTVPGYGGLRVELPSPTPSAEDIDAQIDRMRAPFATVTDVERPVVRGDQVSIDVVGNHDGEEEPFLDRGDYLYEVGSNNLVEELDDRIIGASAGDVIDFRVDHPDHDHPAMNFKVAILQVKERVLPELTDAWVAENSDHETIEALRADLATRLTAMRAMQGQMALRDKTLKALADLVDEEVPDALVAEETRSQAQDLVMRLQAQGLQLEQWMAITGKDQVELTEELKANAVIAVKVDLALRAVADAEQLEADEDDVDAEIARIAERARQKPAQVRKAYERNDAMGELKADIRKRKAMDWLLERVEIVDPDGHTIERSALQPSLPAADESPATDADTADTPADPAPTETESA